MNRLLHRWSVPATSPTRHLERRKGAISLAGVISLSWLAWFCGSQRRRRWLVPLRLHKLWAGMIPVRKSEIDRFIIKFIIDRDIWANEIVR